MNGPQHYAEAEYQLSLVEKKSINSEEVVARMAKAQVHATLALVAAVVEADEIDSFEVAVTGKTGLTEWGKAVRKS